MNFFLDTNAVVKLCHDEVGTENLVTFLSRYYSDMTLTIADITQIEFRSAFFRMVRTGEVDLSQVKEICRAFDASMAKFHVVRVERNVKYFSMRFAGFSRSRKKFANTGCHPAFISIGLAPDSPDRSVCQL